jgi:hypothetical protein
MISVMLWSKRAIRSKARGHLQTNVRAVHSRASPRLLQSHHSSALPLEYTASLVILRIRHAKFLMGKSSGPITKRKEHGGCASQMRAVKRPYLLSFRLGLPRGNKTVNSSKFRPEIKRLMRQEKEISANLNPSRCKRFCSISWISVKMSKSAVQVLCARRYTINRPT